MEKIAEAVLRAYALYMHEEYGVDLVSGSIEAFMEHYARNSDPPAESRAVGTHEDQRKDCTTCIAQPFTHDLEPCKSCLHFSNWTTQSD